MNNWLQTSGSPFVIIEESGLAAWNPSDNYSRLCTATNYLECMKIAGTDILVFGDESFPLRLIARNSDIIIVRWVYAPDEQTVDSIIASLDLAHKQPSETVSIHWKTMSLILFDSIQKYDEIADNCIRIEAKKHDWTVDTFEYKNKNVFLIIHKIR